MRLSKLIFWSCSWELLMFLILFLGVADVSDPVPGSCWCFWSCPWELLMFLILFLGVADVSYPVPGSCWCFLSCPWELLKFLQDSKPSGICYEVFEAASRHESDRDVPGHLASLRDTTRVPQSVQFEGSSTILACREILAEPGPNCTVAALGRIIQLYATRLVRCHARGDIYKCFNDKTLKWNATTGKYRICYRCPCISLIN